MHIIRNFAACRHAAIIFMHDLLTFMNFMHSPRFSAELQRCAKFA
jgi:hypothetical protein